MHHAPASHRNFQYCGESDEETDDNSDLALNCDNNASLRLPSFTEAQFGGTFARECDEDEDSSTKSDVLINHDNSNDKCLLNLIIMPT